MEVGEIAEPPSTVDPALKRLGMDKVVIPPLDDVQKELLDIEVDSIPEDKLFIPVPLAARLAYSNVTVV